MKRYVKEYAKDKARHLRALAKETPGAANEFKAKAREVERILDLAAFGSITVDEAMFLIADV